MRIPLCKHRKSQFDVFIPQPKTAPMGSSVMQSDPYLVLAPMEGLVDPRIRDLFTRLGRL